MALPTDPMILALPKRRVTTFHDDLTRDADTLERNLVAILISMLASSANDCPCLDLATKVFFSRSIHSVQSLECNSTTVTRKRVATRLGSR